MTGCRQAAAPDARASPSPGASVPRTGVPGPAPARPHSPAPRSTTPLHHTARPHRTTKDHHDDDRRHHQHLDLRPRARHLPADRQRRLDHVRDRTPPAGHVRVQPEGSDPRRGGRPRLHHVDGQVARLRRCHRPLGPHPRVGLDDVRPRRGDEPREDLGDHPHQPVQPRDRREDVHDDAADQRWSRRHEHRRGGLRAGVLADGPVGRVPRPRRPLPLHGGVDERPRAPLVRGLGDPPR